MSEVNFFVPKGPFYINDLFKELSVQKNQSKITDVKTLDKADKCSITFLNSNDYIDLAKIDCHDDFDSFIKISMSVRILIPFFLPATRISFS